MHITIHRMMSKATPGMSRDIEPGLPAQGAMQAAKAEGADDTDDDKELVGADR